MTSPAVRLLSTQTPAPRSESVIPGPQPQAVTAPARGARVESSSWGYSTLSSCGAAVDRCTCGIFSALQRRSVELWTRFVNYLIDIYNSLNRQTVPAQTGSTPQPAGVALVESGVRVRGRALAQEIEPSESLTPKQFLAKWSNARNRNTKEFEMQWWHDFRVLPKDFQVQSWADICTNVFNDPDLSKMAAFLIMTWLTGDRRVLDIIEKCAQNPSIPNIAQNDPVTRPITREDFLNKWEKILKKPPKKPTEKERTDWATDIQNLPEPVCDKIHQFYLAPLMARYLQAQAKGEPVEFDISSREKIYRDSFLSPDIIKIVQNYQAKPASVESKEDDKKADDKKTAEAIDLYD